MTQSTRLGSAEGEALRELRARGGRWSVEDQALWENRHWTLRLMASLSRKGCVQVTGVGTFSITAEGRAAAVGLNPSL